MNFPHLQQKASKKIAETVKIIPRSSPKINPVEELKLTNKVFDYDKYIDYLERLGMPYKRRFNYNIEEIKDKLENR